MENQQETGSEIEHTRDIDSENSLSLETLKGFASISACDRQNESIQMLMFQSSLFNLHLHFDKILFRLCLSNGFTGKLPFFFLFFGTK